MLSTTVFNPTERNDLYLHLQQCASARGRFHRLHCVVEAVDALVAPRFVTTLGATTILMLALAFLY